MSLSDQLDPEIAAAVEALAIGDIDAETVALARSVSFEVPPSDDVERVDHVVPGEPDISVRVTRPKGSSGVLPCVYAMHGGGYVIGTNAMDDPIFEDFVPELGFIGVSVDYRLAPDTPYPGPLEDCYRGLQWTHDHATDLGIDPGGIGVMGVSAGGGLAAALCLLARDRVGPPIAFQLLDQPMLDDRQITPSSRQEGLPVWSRESNTFGWKAYLGDLYGRDDVPATAAPARATDLSGLPPAFVSVGALDGFLDEDVDYALRLNGSGVPAELHVYPGACHGFNVLAGEAPVTQLCSRTMEAWLARQLRRR